MPRYKCVGPVPYCWPEGTVVPGQFADIPYADAEVGLANGDLVWVQAPEVLRTPQPPTKEVAE